MGEDHFLDCGNIVAVRSMRDQLIGVGRGVGYELCVNTGEAAGRPGGPTFVCR